MKADFSGYATKAGLKCSDGLVIHAQAFKDQDKARIPLVWQHQHNEPANVLGYATLEHRDDGVYAYGFFNETPSGKNAKLMVQHGDVTALSIYANQLVKQGVNVMHGAIRELSLVLAGANPGAFIDKVYLAHGDSVEALEDEGIIYTGLTLEHAGLSKEESEEKTDEEDVVEDDEDTEESDTEDDADELDEDDEDDEDGADEDDDDEEENPLQDVFDSLTEEQSEVVHYMIGEALKSAADDSYTLTHADTGGNTMAEKTVKDVWDSLSEEQQNVVHFMIGEALAGEEGDDNDTENIKHSEGTHMNVFDQTEASSKTTARTHLSHDQIRTIVDDGIKMGSFKDGFLAHAEDFGINNIELLFSDAKATSAQPELIARQAEWVPKVLGATKHVPFAKIKSLVADITAEEARAKGYIKGTEKKEEVVQLLRRTTGPTTIYKKQKLDRDDIIDITDFDVIAWLKWEIRFMLNEELARAILIGDGRSALHADKIKDPKGAIDGTGIRSIAFDNDLYAVKVDLPANVSSDTLIDEVTRSRTSYRGSGTPTFYTTDKTITDLLLLKDKMGRRLYGTEAELASALRVKEIVAVEVMEEDASLLGIIVNLVDYSVGTNKGGELSFFEDFDIDFNQNKYLLETRSSGALTKPKSAIVIRREQGIAVTAGAPSFNGATNTITIPTTVGVVYLIDANPVSGDVVITKDTEVTATAAEGYYLEPNSTTSWSYTYTAA